MYENFIKICQEKVHIPTWNVGIFHILKILHEMISFSCFSPHSDTPVFRLENNGLNWLWTGSIDCHIHAQLHWIRYHHPETMDSLVLWILFTMHLNIWNKAFFLRINFMHVFWEDSLIIHFSFFINLWLPWERRSVVLLLSGAYLMTEDSFPMLINL